MLLSLIKLFIYGALVALAAMSHAGPLGYDSRISSYRPIGLKINKFSKDGIDPSKLITLVGLNNPYAAIGRIKTHSKVQAKADNNGVLAISRGTGFLISPCLVMTNYHVVFGKSKSPTPFAAVSFTAAQTVTGKVVAWGPKNQSQQMADDWAVIELDAGQCLGLEVGWFEPPTLDVDDYLKTPVTMAGYPGKESDPESSELWAHQGCFFKNHSPFPSTFFNDCATRRGQSGSPIFYQSKDGVFRYLAMQTGEQGPTDKILKKFVASRANVAINMVTVLLSGPIDLLTADLKKYGNNCSLTNKMVAGAKAQCY